jgi:hypothetical protein
MSSEFHFAAVDRGVPIPWLSGSRDQRLHALSFSHHLASTMADPCFVGVDWFQWLDQSAAGRKDRENHQCGFIVVAGHANPELVDVVSNATQQMYSVRSKGKRYKEHTLVDLLKN